MENKKHSTPQILTRFSPHKRESISEWSPSKTKSEFADQCDIRNIVKRFKTTGQLPQINPNITENFGDATLYPTYEQATQIVTRANQSFAQLPSHIRSRFENDPNKLMEFMSDKENKDEAIKLGLLKAPKVPEPLELDKKEVVPPVPPPLQPPPAKPGDV